MVDGGSKGWLLLFDTGEGGIGCGQIEKSVHRCSE
jgi:hypothetical protein